MTARSTALEAVRSIARRARHAAEAAAPAGDDLDGILDAACKARGVSVETDRDGRLRGDEGRLIRRRRGVPGGVILVAADLGERARRHVLAHEIGHYDLHDLRLETRGTPYLVDGVRRLDPGYSTRSLIEMQAEAFAEEFLCPTADLAGDRHGCQRLLEEGMLDGDLIRRQAVLTLIPPQRDFAAARPPALDDDQEQAVGSPGKSITVLGAPGTGKTTVVVARAVRLLDRGVPASGIAVIAHSDQAAERLRSAIATVRPREAATMWCGTQTALMFEIVACHAARAGLPAGFGVLDPVAVRALLGRHVGEFARGAAVDLDRAAAVIVRRRRGRTDPASGAADLLPGELADLVEEAYAAAKADAGGADRTDLFDKAADLMVHEADVAARFAGRFEHLLVDDTQDLRARCVDVLRIAVAAGSSIFCTSGTVPTIRGFDGASRNALSSLLTGKDVQRFELLRRHRRPCVALRASIAPVTTGRSPANAGPPCVASGKGGSTDIAAAVRRLVRLGTPAGRQAVLVRSNARARSLAIRLSAFGIPVMHFGEFGRREEVLDLCAVAGLDDGDPAFARARLERLVRLETYKATPKDVSRIVTWAAERRVDLIGALGAAATIVGMTARGSIGLRRLGEELRGLSPRTATWTALTTWLFERSDYLDGLAETQPEAALQRLAIAHVLETCAMQETLGEFGGKALEARLRWAGSMDVVGGLSAIDLDRYDVDAVRIMTVHAAQGLEFEAVHVEPATMLAMQQEAASGDGAALAIATTRVRADAITHRRRRSRGTETCAGASTPGS